MGNKTIIGLGRASQFNHTVFLVEVIVEWEDRLRIWEQRKLIWHMIMRPRGTGRSLLHPKISTKLWCCLGKMIALTPPRPSNAVELAECKRGGKKSLIVSIVGAIYIMYSRQLLWGILISYRKWNEINFISFTANISFLISNAISFLHSVYFIFSKFYFIHSQHLYHSPTEFVSFTCGMYLILPWHLFHL